MPKVVPHPATYVVPAVVAVVAAAAVIAWLAVVDDPTTGEVVLAIAAGALALATLFLSIETLGRRRAVFAAAIADAAQTHSDALLLLRQFKDHDGDVRETRAQAAATVASYHQLCSLVPEAMRSPVGEALASSMGDLERQVYPAADTQ